MTGKHAIYLIVEGPEVKQPERGQRPQWGKSLAPVRPVGLMDLHGIGFAKAGATCEPIDVPTVSISVDGHELAIPSEPIHSNNANGLTEARTYQLYAPVQASSVVSVKVSDPVVKTEVGKLVDGRATVRCTYNGQTKVFLIN